MKTNNKENWLQKTKKHIAKLHSRVVKQEEPEKVPQDLPVPKHEPQKMIVEIAAGSVVRSTLAVIAVVVLLYLLYSIGGILLVFFTAFFIASALDPLIDILQKRKVPRAIAIILVYLVLFFLIALFFANLLPLVAAQLFSLASVVNNFVIGVSRNPVESLPFGAQLKPYVEQLLQAVDLKVVAAQLQSSLQMVSSQLLSLGGNLWTVLLQLSNGLLNLVLVMILVFFMTVDEEAMVKSTVSIFPERYAPYISERIDMIRLKIGQWIRGQVMVSLVAAIITFIGLAIAGVEYSLLISVVTGICMIVPVFGRVIAAIIALPIVLNQSPALALFLIIYYFAISQVENNILVPLLMNKAVGLSPIVIIFALMVGFQFMGLFGLILAIPMATILAIFAKDLGHRFYKIEKAK